MSLQGFLNRFSNLKKEEDIPCSYYEDKDASYIYQFIPNSKLNPRIIEYFISFGFRRSGSIFYSTICKKCQQCIPYRVRLKDLKFNSSQRKNLKKNSSITFTVNKPNPTPLKEEIYLRYIRTCHPEDKEFLTDEYILETMYSQMYHTDNSCWELEFYDGSRLVGFGILDIGFKLASAVYNVYDPDYLKRGIGTFMICKTMEWLRSENLFEYYYLGLFLPGHPKMDYKKNFQPGEILHPLTKKWVPVQEIL